LGTTLGRNVGNYIVWISLYCAATLYCIASTRSSAANQRHDCCLSTIVDVYTGDNSSPQSPVRCNAVMTTMMDLRRDVELCLFEGHATYMQIVLARLCYINKVLINTNEADTCNYRLFCFTPRACLPYISDGRIYAHSSWIIIVCKYDVLLILL